MQVKTIRKLKTNENYDKEIVYENGIVFWTNNSGEVVECWIGEDNKSVDIKFLKDKSIKKTIKYVVSYLKLFEKLEKDIKKLKDEASK